MFVTERKEIVCTPFYLPLHHSVHTVGISAMFHSLQPTSSLGVGKHEQDNLLSSANADWDGKFNCILKNVLFHPQVGPSKIFQLINSSVFELHIASGIFCWFCLRSPKGTHTNIQRDVSVRYRASTVIPLRMQRENNDSELILTWEMEISPSPRHLSWQSENTVKYLQ